MYYDVLIVGGGPAGLYTALHIRNLDALVLEEHEKIGIPKHCAGIVGTWTARQILGISSKLVTNSYRTIKFITPGGHYTILSKIPILYHIDRPELENVIACKVELLGHKIVTGQRARPTWGLRVRALNRDLSYNYLVVADGASSLFRRVLIGERGSYLYGLQIVVRVKTQLEDAIVIVYDNINPEFFAWLIPLDTTIAKIGFASRNPLYKYIEIVARKSGVEISSIIEKFGGLIPLNTPPKNPVLASRIVLHGDAVPLVKPYTGGGLFWIFKLTPTLASFIEKGRLVEYTRYYQGLFYYKNAMERILVNTLRRTRYFTPVRYVHALSRIGLLTAQDFDNHALIALKSLLISPFVYLF